MKKDYSLKKISDLEVHYIDKSEPTNKFYMEGLVVMNLWGGGQGSYAVDKNQWKQETTSLTKQDIWDNINEGFGCESYESCRVIVFQEVSVLRYPVLEDNTLGESKEILMDIEVFRGYINTKDVK